MTPALSSPGLRHQSSDASITTAGPGLSLRSVLIVAPCSTWATEWRGGHLRPGRSRLPSRDACHDKDQEPVRIRPAVAVLAPGGRAPERGRCRSTSLGPGSRETFRRWGSRESRSRTDVPVALWLVDRATPRRGSTGKAAGSARGATGGALPRRVRMPRASRVLTGEDRMSQDYREQLLTPGEVAALFRVDPKTVQSCADKGLLTTTRPPGPTSPLSPSRDRGTAPAGHQQGG